MSPQPPNPELRGYLLGFIGVLIFTVTLPATRHAVGWMDPLFVGLGRTVLAALFAALLLLVLRPPLPRGRQWLDLLGVSLGVVVGFPYLSAVALQTVPSSHGGVVLGVLPLATAVMGAVFAGERPSARFWFFAFLGSLLVAVFALLDGAGGLGWGDVLLFTAVIVAAVGYALGGRIARTLGGWQTICWAVLLAQPLAIPLVLAETGWSLPQAPLEAWLSFLYVALFSQLIGFFAWYRGLAIGGIAKVGQIQLTQTFFTLFFAWFLLGEAITWEVLLFAVLVVACVALGRREKVAR
jgi:drug/metabolite transporter (DMT)-like permease